MPLLAGAVGVGDGVVLETSAFLVGAGVAGAAEGALFEASALAARAGAVGLASDEDEGAAGADAVCAEASFCLSFPSSIWIRCSICSIFFRSASFASPSAAQAVLQPMIDMAVAASSAARREPRFH
jgi:hypothetical protein